MNATQKARLEAVRDHILAEPRRLRMGSWGDKVEGSNAPACNTVGCIAGWTVLLKEPELIQMQDRMKFLHKMSRAAQRARRLLGLTKLQETKLFYAENWQPRFYKAWRNADTREAEAQATANRINFMLRTGK